MGPEIEMIYEDNFEKLSPEVDKEDMQESMEGFMLHVCFLSRCYYWSKISLNFDDNS